MSGNAASEDRRVRKTRHALQHATFELVLEKGYDRVTVAEIIDRADVGRSTFYAHYRDKEDLFLSSIEDEIREAIRIAGDQGAEPDGSPTVWLFRHAGEHADLYRALVRRRGGWALVSRRIEETLVDIFVTRLQDAPSATIPIEAGARSVAGSLMALLTWWLAQGAETDPLEIDETFRAVANHGIEASFGISI